MAFIDSSLVHNQIFCPETGIFQDQGLQFAGAAEELTEALIVNPYNTEEMADCLATALRMGRAERRRRHASLMDTVRRRDTFMWCRDVLAALLYVSATTGMGLVISSLTKSQIAAMFATALLTMIPATQYSGLIDPVSSLQGAGAVIGRIYPTTYFVTIARGTFSKALGFADLWAELVPLLIAIPVLLGAGAALLRKQVN